MNKFENKRKMALVDVKESIFIFDFTTLEKMNPKEGKEEEVGGFQSVYP